MAHSARDAGTLKRNDVIRSEHKTNEREFDAHLNYFRWKRTRLLCQNEEKLQKTHPTSFDLCFIFRSLLCPVVCIEFICLLLNEPTNTALNLIRRFDLTIFQQQKKAWAPTMTTKQSKRASLNAIGFDWMRQQFRRSHRFNLATRRYTTSTIFHFRFIFFFSSSHFVHHSLLSSIIFWQTGASIIRHVFSSLPSCHHRGVSFRNTFISCHKNSTKANSYEKKRRENLWKNMHSIRIFDSFLICKHMKNCIHCHFRYSQSDCWTFSFECVFL